MPEADGVCNLFFASCGKYGSGCGILGAHPDFKLVPSDSPDMPEALRKESSISLTPLRDGTDGFFAAVMERAAPEPEAGIE